MTKDERIIEIIVNGQKANASLKELEGAGKALNSQLKNLTPGTAEFVAKSAQLREVKDRLLEVKESITGVTREQTLMQEGFTRMLGAVAPLELLFKAIEFGKESFDVFKEGQQAVAQVEARLKSTASAAGLSSEKLNEFAESQAHSTLFTKDQVQQLEALGLTFTGIHSEIYQKALPAIEDMATAMANGGEVDMKSSAIQVGKALEDPIKGITALTKVGVKFTEAQKDQIKSFMEAGDKASAQKLILTELNKEFGGSAAAARKAAGAGGDFAEKMHDLEEQVGSLIADGMKILYPILLQLVTGFLVLANGLRTMPEFIKENKELFILLGGAMLALEANTAKAAAMEIYHAAVLRAKSIAARVAAFDMEALNVVLAANPIGIVIMAVAVLVAGFVKLYNSSQTVRAGVAGLWAVCKQSFENIKASFVSNLSGMADLLAGLFTGDWARIKKGASELVDSVKVLGKDVGKAYTDGYHGKVAEEEAAAAAARKKSGKEKVDEAGAQGAAEGEEENSAQRKAREKREKEAAAARKKAQAAALSEAKKHQAELEKARKEFHASVLKAGYRVRKTQGRFDGGRHRENPGQAQAGAG